MSGFWSDILGGGVEAATLMKVADDIRDEGKDAQRALTALGDQAVAGTKFTPYTVAANTGNVGFDGNAMRYNLAPNQQAVSDQLLAGASGLFGASLQDPAAREQSIYDRLTAVQDPQIERERLAMESRLQRMGRSGVVDSRYGATPELFAQEKAIQEARNQLAVNAIEQARAQQLQDANIGSTYLRNSYLPESQLMNAYNPALELSNLSQTGQIAGQNLRSQLGLGGVQSKINADLAASNLYAGLFGSLSDVAGNFGSRIDSGFEAGKGLWDSIKGAFGF